MKHIKLLFAGAFFLISGTLAYSQSETSAVRLLDELHNNIGSARYQAMSGSMGALGVEYSSVNINPAGICLNKSGGARTSLSFGLDTSLGFSKWYGSNRSDVQNKFRFDEFSWSSSNKWNDFGFSYGFGIQRGANFNRSINIEGNMYGRGSSMADYVAGSLNRGKGKTGVVTQEDFDKVPDAFNNYPWLHTLAAQNLWITSDQGKGLLYYSNFRVNPDGGVFTAANSSLFSLRERGNSMKYSFTMGFDLTKNLYLGLLTDFYMLDYDLSYFLKENHRPDKKGNPENLSLLNKMSIKGGGADFGIGLIYEPTDGLRLGLGAYSPIYYSLKQHFYAKANSTVLGQSQTATTPEDGYNAFELASPWRLTASVAYIFGHLMSVNVDYEASMFNTISLRNENGDGEDFQLDNMAIKEDFTLKNTVRLGTEINLTNRVALRAGFAYTSSGVRKSLIGKDNIPNRELFVSGTQTYYSLNRGNKNFSIGLGFKLTPRLSMDIAFADNISDNFVYAFPVVSDPSPTWVQGSKEGELFFPGYDPIKHTRHLFHETLTFSYRF